MLNIPEEIKLNYEIPMEKYFNVSSEYLSHIKSIRWIGSIKPAIMQVEAVVNDELRYEEIQIILIESDTTRYVYELAKDVFREIKYPLVLIVKCGEKETIGVCPFEKGKRDSDKNILKRMIFSHWMTVDYMSEKSSKMVTSINERIRNKGNLYDMYMDIKAIVTSNRMSGTSKAHCYRIIEDLVGKISKAKKDAILADCEPYEYHTVLKKFSGRRTRNYMLIYDYELFWQCLMKNANTRKVIEKRRYRDVEDMFYSIDSKGW